MRNSVDAVGVGDLRGDASVRADAELSEQIPGGIVDVAGGDAGVGRRAGTIERVQAMGQNGSVAIGRVHGPATAVIGAVVRAAQPADFCGPSEIVVVGVNEARKGDPGGNIDSHLAYGLAKVSGDAGDLDAVDDIGNISIAGLARVGRDALTHCKSPQIL